MATEKNPKLFDLRVVERNIAKGLITRDEYEAYLQSIDDSAERAEKIEADRRRMSLCLTLIFINVAIFLVQAIIEVHGSKETRLVVQDYFCLSAEGLANGHVWQIFTYQFMHAAPSPWHLLFNMIALFFFGPLVERFLGGKRYLAFY